MIEDTFENKEIKGLTYKTAAWMLGTLLCGMVSTMIYINSIKESITALTSSIVILVEKGKYDKQNIDLQIQFNASRIVELQGRVTILETKSK